MPIKRVYSEVRVEALPEGGYGIWLDSSQLKTRGGKQIVLPRRHYAELLAAEWAAQGDVIKPATMPITRLINVAIDQTPKRRAELVEEIRRYGETDLLLYRAPEPRELTLRQSSSWDPVLSWASEQGIDLKTTTSLAAARQDPKSLGRLASNATDMPDIELTLFGHYTSVFGSALLALAVMQGYLSAEEAFELSRLDEAYQTEYWGEDLEAVNNAQVLKDETTQLAKLLMPDAS